MQSRRFGGAFLVAVLLAVGDGQAARADPAVTAIVLGGFALTGYGLFRDKTPPTYPSMAVVGVGAFDVVDAENRAAAFRAEVRPGFTWHRFGTVLGVEATTDGGFIGYAGLRVDVTLFSKVILSPNVSIAGYEAGGGKDLGAPVVFRSGIDGYWRFSNGSRFGVSFHHLSHARLFGGDNPGTETAYLTYSVPLDRVF